MVGGFPQDSLPFPPLLHFVAAPSPPHSTLVAPKTSAVKRRVAPRKSFTSMGRESVVIFFEESSRNFLRVISGNQWKTDIRLVGPGSPEYESSVTSLGSSFDEDWCPHEAPGSVAAIMVTAASPRHGDSVVACHCLPQ